MDKYKQIDILAIGDIATDVFIKIKEADTEYDKEDGGWKLCLDYGGKIPYESKELCYAVGNSSNVAISISNLGLKSSLISYVGKDEIGNENIKKLNEENVQTDYIKIVDGLESNYHYVLWYKGERTILVKHTEFPYSFPKELEEPKWIYLSSLASNSISYHNEISEYIENHPNVFLAFQPGTLQIRLGVDAINNLYKNAKVLLCNQNEAQKILGVKENDIPKLLKMMYEIGPKIVIITNGIKGAYSYDGNEILFMNAFYDKNKTIEVTGAGDSFSGAFMAALVLGKTIFDALIWGAVNAKSVVEYVGPHKGLLNRDQIEEYIKNIPEDYKPIKIN